MNLCKHKTMLSKKKKKQSKVEKNKYMLSHMNTYNKLGKHMQIKSRTEVIRAGVGIGGMEFNRVSIHYDEMFWRW